MVHKGNLLTMKEPNCSDLSKDDVASNILEVLENFCIKKIVDQKQET